MVVAEEPSPGVGAGSCFGNPVPALSGPTISSVARKARLKTMRVGQRTEKTRTVCSLQLSRPLLMEPWPRERSAGRGWWS